MSETSLRALAPLRFDLSATVRVTEAVLTEISALVANRQALRAASAPFAQLEQNRLQIARAQWELSHALIRRYRPPAAAALAASSP